MSIEYERKKFKILKEMVDNYRIELLKNREIALDMPIETDNGFNVERETLIDDIDEKLEILKRHIDDPYFAKLVFEDIDDGENFNGYIGRVSVGELNDPEDNKVVDWRAPISDLYYNGRLGETDYTAHGKKFNVNLKLKRQIEIKDGEVKSIYDFEDAVSSDEFLKPYLTQSADNRLKSIVSTIQQEQNEIIRLPIFQNCIVQGVAGSGKTTVALHRISYLMYNYKKAVKPDKYLIISPNEIFMSYISSILSDLDADKANSYSINTVILNLINGFKILNKHEQYVHLKKENISTNYLSFKNNKDFKTIIDKYFDSIIESTFRQPVKLYGIEVLGEDETIKYFRNVRENTLEEILEHGCKKLGLTLAYDEKFRNKIMSKINFSNIEITQKEKARKLIESGNYGYLKKIFKCPKDPIKLYKDFIQNINKFTDYSEVDILKKYTLNNLKNKRLAYDDLAPVLYIISKLNILPYYSSLKCVFIDEAQDLSELMFIALKNVFKNATFGIFGDISQGIYSYQSIDNWGQVMEILKDPKLLYLNRSYRTSIEIMEEANKTLQKLGVAPANNVVRHAEAVERCANNDVETISVILEKNKSKYNNTVIICKDDNELREASVKLSKLNLAVLDENNLSYDNNHATILTVQTAKGLEFDAVIIYDYSSYSESTLDLRLLYVAETRALHKLTLCKAS